MSKPWGTRTCRFLELRAAAPLALLAWLFLVLSGLPSPVRAEIEDAGMYRGWKIGKFKIHGIKGSLAGELRNGLALSGRKKLLWRTYPLFDPGDLLQDVQRTQLFLARNGYPSAHIDPQFKADAGGKKVELTFEIDPGPAVLVSENRTRAFPPELERKARKVLKLKEGERFSDATVEKRTADLIDILKRGGYAFPTVQASIARPDSHHVEVEFVVNAGDIYVFGPTRVQGISEDLVEVARRTMAIPEGSRYSPDRIDAANDNLRLLDLFRQIRVYTERGPDHELVVIADLAERKMESVNAGVGYWTEDKMRVNASYKNRNILRAGRGLGVDASYSRYLQEASLTYWRPALFHSRTRGSLALKGRRESEPGYEIKTGEIEAAATYIPSTKTTFRPSVTLSLIDIRSFTEPPTFKDPGPSLVSGTILWIREDVDNRLNPARGERRSLRLEGGLPGFDLTRKYTVIEPEQIVYYPVIPKRLVWAGRVRLGLAGPRRETSYFLPNKRLYGGGANSMRGIGRNKLGPLDEEGRPLGGVAKAEASMELRFPIFWRIFGATFADAGQVWGRYADVTPSDLRYAVGPGLGMNTPIGSVRVDVGFLLGHRRPSESRAVLNLSIGNAF